MNNLVKKSDYNAKVNEIKGNSRKFCCKIAQANLIIRSGFSAKLSSLNRKITSNKTKHLLFENELKKLKTFDLGYFIGKSHVDEDGAQSYLVF